MLSQPVANRGSSSDSRWETHSSLTGCSDDNTCTCIHVPLHADYSIIYLLQSYGGDLVKKETSQRIKWDIRRLYIQVEDINNKHNL